MTYFTQGQMIISHHRVGVIIRKDLKADYKEIIEKNCVATVKL